MESDDDRAAGKQDQRCLVTGKHDTLKRGQLGTNRTPPHQKTKLFITEVSVLNKVMVLKND